MHDAYAKMDNFYFIEGLVKVIVNIIKNIVSFKILQTVPFLRAKKRQGKSPKQKLKSS